MIHSPSANVQLQAQQHQQVSKATNVATAGCGSAETPWSSSVSTHHQIAPQWCCCHLPCTVAASCLTALCCYLLQHDGARCAASRWGCVVGCLLKPIEGTVPHLPSQLLKNTPVRMMNACSKGSTQQQGHILYLSTDTLPPIHALCNAPPAACAALLLLHTPRWVAQPCAQFAVPPDAAAPCGCKH